MTISSPLDPALEAILEAITAWNPHQAKLERWSDDTLDALAMPLFARQYRGNQALRALCDRRGLGPGSVTSWKELPAIPTDAFKYMRMSCVSEPETHRTFLTSGTTQGARGAHHFGVLDVYEAALLKSFARYIMPDQKPHRFLVLAPDEDALPESSLSFMLSSVVDRFGAKESSFFIEMKKDGELQFDLVGVLDALDDAEQEGETVVILATAFALMQLFDAYPERRWKLPAGSRLMETGGFKGRSREVSREELYGLFSARFGLPATHCVSEYSMTELSSQAYTPFLRRALTSQNRDLVNTPLYEVPPWVRIQVVDPMSLKPLEGVGEVGLVQWFDLANVESTLIVQTSDRGRLDEDGRLELLGRAPDSELRGCSLTIEELLEEGS